ncbi:unnamed protein product [Urochloa humidicola]
MEEVVAVEEYARKRQNTETQEKSYVQVENLTDTTSQMEEESQAEGKEVVTVEDSLETKKDTHKSNIGENIKNTKKTQDPVQATRNSKRVQRTGIPISTLAVNRAKEKNLEIPGVLWSIWKARNAFVFDNKITQAPQTLIHKALTQLDYWKPLLN